MKKQQTTSFMLLTLYGLLICGLLVLAVTGAQSYATVTEAKNKHIRERGALSFVQTQIASCGGRDNVQLRSGPEGTAVCVRETDSNYETRVYLYDGGLYTEFTRTELPMDPQNAERLCETESFTAEWENEQLLRVEADGKSASIWCPGGGGDEK